MRVAIWLGFAVVVAGCEQSTWELTRSGVHAGGDAGTDGGTCSGQCVPTFSLDENDGWEPVTLWTGSEGPAPECEAGMEDALEGYVDLIVSNDCPACACAPSVGTCKPPETITVHSEACYQPGSTDMSFNPPAGWGGTCNADTAIPADCGGVPCARSVTIGPMAIAEESCMPVAQPIPHVTPPAPTWGQLAKACKMAKQHINTDDHGLCVASGQDCFPQVEVYQYCYRKHALTACPSVGSYTALIVVYAGYDDHRTCTDCTCGLPQGSVCEGAASVYSDSTCLQLEGACMVDSSNSCCVDLLPGTALGSKDITQPTYTPGACEAMGGTVKGGLELIDPWTFCCPPLTETE